MIKAFKSLIIIIFFSTITIHANSETSWITKKDSNKKKIVKENKKVNSSLRFFDKANKSSNDIM